MLQVFIVWLERVASDVTGFYCLVRESCFRCYMNIVWIEGVASDVTGFYCLVRESCFRCYRFLLSG